MWRTANREMFADHGPADWVQFVRPMNAHLRVVESLQIVRMLAPGCLKLRLEALVL